MAGSEFGMAKNKGSNRNAVKSAGPATATGKKNGKGGPPQKSRSRAIAMLSGVLALILAGVLFAMQRPSAEAKREMDTVTIETSRGQVVLEVYPSKMPGTVKNFEDLANKGFYNGLTWHRVEDWVIQTGDPTATGSGGSGKTIKLEVSPDLKNLRGSVGMARSDNLNSASSQFYVLKTDASWLDGRYAIFGKVVSGMDVIDQIQQGDKMTSVTVKQGPPSDGSVTK